MEAWAANAQGRATERHGEDTKAVWRWQQRMDERGKADQDLSTVGRTKEAWLGCAETGQKYMQAANEKSRNGGGRVVGRARRSADGGSSSSRERYGRDVSLPLARK